uniref:Uncharacterized protein n=2 Tax=Lotharella globosa TaxID=91324 RepID=A0A7S3ZBU3_9EUKA
MVAVSLEQKRAVNRVSRAIVVYNLAVGVLVGGLLLGLFAADIHSGDEVCYLSFPLSLSIYCLCNILKLRLLILRTALMDSGRARRCIRSCLIETMTITLVAILLALILEHTLFGKNELLVLRPSEACGGNYCVAENTSVESVAISLIVDLVFNAAALGMYIPALWNPHREESRERYRKLAIRTLAWNSLQVLSTTAVHVFYIVIVTVDMEVLRSTLILLLSADLLINLMCINMTWECKFYWVVLCQLCPCLDRSTLNRNAPKKTGSRWSGIDGSAQNDSKCIPIGHSRQSKSVPQGSTNPQHQPKGLCDQMRRGSTLQGTTGEDIHLK